MMTGLKARAANHATGQTTAHGALAIDVAGHAAIEANAVLGTGPLFVVRHATERAWLGLGGIGTVGFNVSDAAAAVANGGNVAL